MDEKLIEAVQKVKNGEMNFFEEIYNKTSKMVYFTALKILGDSVEAEDVTQETYLLVVQNIATLTDAKAFIKWLKTIAVNVSRNHLAKKKPVLFATDEQEAEILSSIPETDESILPIDCADNKETCRLVMAMIDRLPEKQRIAVIMYYYEEKSIAEIAMLLNVNENTIKSRLNYARKYIKDEVLALEKQDHTKLYSGALLPFFMQIIEKSAEEISVPSTLLAKIQSGFAATAQPVQTSTVQGTYQAAVQTSTVKGAAGQMSAQAAGKVATSTLGGAIKGFLATVAGKVVAGVVAVAIVAGGTVGIVAAVNSGNGNQFMDEVIALDPNADGIDYETAVLQAITEGEDFNQSEYDTIMAYSDYCENRTNVLMSRIMDDNAFEIRENMREMYNEFDALRSKVAGIVNNEFASSIISDTPDFALIIDNLESYIIHNCFSTSTMERFIDDALYQASKVEELFVGNVLYETIDAYYDVLSDIISFTERYISIKTDADDTYTESLRMRLLDIESIIDMEFVNNNSIAYEGTLSAIETIKELASQLEVIPEETTTAEETTTVPEIVEAPSIFLLDGVQSILDPDTMSAKEVWETVQEIRGKLYNNEYGTLLEPIDDSFTPVSYEGDTSFRWVEKLYRSCFTDEEYESNYRVTSSAALANTYCSFLSYYNVDGTACVFSSLSRPLNGEETVINNDGLEFEYYKIDENNMAIAANEMFLGAAKSSTYMYLTKDEYGWKVSKDYDYVAPEGYVSPMFDLSNSTSPIDVEGMSARDLLITVRTVRSYVAHPTQAVVDDSAFGYAPISLNGDSSFAWVEALYKKFYTEEAYAEMYDTETNRIETYENIDGNAYYSMHVGGLGGDTIHGSEYKFTVQTDKKIVIEASWYEETHPEYITTTETVLENNGDGWKIASYGLLINGSYSID